MAKWNIFYFFSLMQIMISLRIHAAEIYSDPNYSFVHNATESPLLLRNYDYIIVGGGTSGCPLAATLSQNFTVLLLERGGEPYTNGLVESLIGFYPDLLFSTPTSASQAFTSEDGVPNQRARVLGGGSAINAGFFTFADAAFITESGWDPVLVNESFVWVADVVAQFPTVQVFQSAARDALLEAGVTPYNGLTFEHLVGTKVGGSLFDSNGYRHTAADLLTYANPDNIDVYIWGTVQQILLSTSPTEAPGEMPEPRAIGVVFSDLDGNNHTALLNEDAGSEVILTAGALGSPQLLMLSGIGPADHLAAFGIPTLVNNPAIGARMADNPTNSFWVLTNQEVEVTLIQVVGITSFGSYIEISSGQAEALQSELQRNAESVNGTNSEYRDNRLGDRNVTATSLRASIIDAILEVPVGMLRSQATWSGTIVQKIWGPLSFGELRLASLDAADNPSVRFNYFQVDEDLATCEQGIRMVWDTVHAPALASLQYTNDSVPLALRPVFEAVLGTWPLRNFMNDTQDSINIRQWCMDSVTTIWHYHGGALVGDVVDESYRVLGVESLRVIDGSTFARSPGTNPQATVMMLGRSYVVADLGNAVNVGLSHLRDETTAITNGYSTGIQNGAIDKVGKVHGSANIAGEAGCSCRYLIQLK